MFILQKPHLDLLFVHSTIIIIMNSTFTMFIHHRDFCHHNHDYDISSPSIQLNSNLIEEWIDVGDHLVVPLLIEFNDGSKVLPDWKLSSGFILIGHPPPQSVATNNHHLVSIETERKTSQNCETALTWSWSWWEGWIYTNWNITKSAKTFWTELWHFANLFD